VLALRQDCPKGASSPRGAATVAVRAHHLALLHLVEDVIPPPAREGGADRERLVAQVVELEHDRVSFAAIDARVDL
jgi:hypothetical protein